MIRALYYTTDDTLRVNLSPDEFPKALQDRRSLLWVDFVETSPAEDEPILRQTFGFHPLAVDDALQESHVPKIDDWEEYLYIVLHAVTFDHKANQALDTLELDIFVGSHYIVTHHDEPIAALERVWNACQRDPRYGRNGADYLLYRLTDEVVASYMPIVEQMDDEIDRIEDQVFGNPSPQVLERIFTIKRAVLHLRRIISPQREVLNRLARDDFKVIDRKAHVYFRDVYDHLVRLNDIIESLRDLIGGTLDTYLSVINNRMNEIMKTLTIITTLFMPLSFLTGFFGMNFFQPVVALEAWTDRPAFLVTLALTLLVPFGMYQWMRRRGWM